MKITKKESKTHRYLLKASYGAKDASFEGPEEKEHETEISGCCHSYSCIQPRAEAIMQTFTPVGGYMIKVIFEKIA